MGDGAGDRSAQGHDDAAAAELRGQQRGDSPDPEVRSPPEWLSVLSLLSLLSLLVPRALNVMNDRRTECWWLLVVGDLCVWCEGVCADFECPGGGWAGAQGDQRRVQLRVKDAL